MGSVFLGWVLIVLGVIFMMLGAGAAAKELLTRKEEERPEGVIDIIKALTEFVKALTAAPQWLALSIVGLVLVIYGGLDSHLQTMKGHRVDGADSPAVCKDSTLVSEARGAYEFELLERRTGPDRGGQGGHRLDALGPRLPGWRVVVADLRKPRWPIEESHHIERVSNWSESADNRWPEPLRRTFGDVLEVAADSPVCTSENLAQPLRDQHSVNGANPVVGQDRRPV